MGLFDFFRKDPAADLERAENLLAEGQAAEALRLVEGVLAKASGELRQRAEPVATAARRQVVDHAVGESQALCEAELFDEAAEWLRIAIERCAEEERGALGERLADIEERAAVQAQAEYVAEHLPEAASMPELEVDTHAHYEALVAMLDPRLVPRYQDRPEAFRRVVVELHSGGAKAEGLDRWVEEDPEDPVPRFERGHGRLQNGDFHGARGDLEAVWDALGTAPLDLAGRLAIPALWAEAVLALGEPRQVLDRFETLDDGDRAHPEVIQMEGRALLAVGQAAEARSLLAWAVGRHPDQPELSLLLGHALEADGHPELAIDCLEQAIAPSCASGSCGQPVRHLPSFRRLARLHLESESGRPQRARELLLLIAEAQGGQLSTSDGQLVSLFLEKTGQAEEAEQIAALIVDGGEDPGAPADHRLAGGRPIL